MSPNHAMERTPKAFGVARLVLLRVHSLVTKVTVIAACSIGVLRLGAATPADQSTEISADRAWHLASGYYHRHVNGCGGVGPVILRGDSWEAPVHFGVTGQLRGSIHVDRHTGNVSDDGYPSISARSLDREFASAKAATPCTLTKRCSELRKLSESLIAFSLDHDGGALFS
jgi:hypothetical protein